MKPATKESRRAAHTWRAWKIAFRVLNQSLQRHRDSDLDAHGFSSSSFGARYDSATGKWILEAYKSYPGDLYEPPGVDVIDLDGEPADTLEAALRRVLTLEVDDTIGNRLADYGMYEAWYESERAFQRAPVVPK